MSSMGGWRDRPHSPSLISRHPMHFEGTQPRRLPAPPHTLRRIMKRCGVRLPRWKRPANLRRTSTSSRLRSSQVEVPSLMGGKGGGRGPRVSMNAGFCIQLVRTWVAGIACRRRRTQRGVAHATRAACMVRACPPFSPSLSRTPELGGELMNLSPCGGATLLHLDLLKLVLAAGSCGSEEGGLFGFGPTWRGQGVVGAAMRGFRMRDGDAWCRHASLGRGARCWQRAKGCSASYIGCTRAGPGQRRRAGACRCPLAPPGPAAFPSGPGQTRGCDPRPGTHVAASARCLASSDRCFRPDVGLPPSRSAAVAAASTRAVRHGSTSAARRRPCCRGPARGAVARRQED
jgi:hypothetical protein